MNTTITSAKIDWNEHGLPLSKTFNDVYFCHQNGLAEAQYVFLAGNHLPARFLTHATATFTIAETGFGTGLNFLTTWQAFRQFKTQQTSTSTVSHLHFISFEQFPFLFSDLQRSHLLWPSLTELSLQLQQQWPIATAGCHRLIFDQGEVILDLWLGDVNKLLPQLDHSYQQSVDAWFLDGFSPAKNPEMWQEGLFKQIRQYTKPNGTLATFTAASIVRQGLQNAGFSLQKIKGFGIKREMITGYLPIDPSPNDSISVAYSNHTRHIAIIGGGISSACTALSLLQHGQSVTLYCADAAPAQGASGNKQGVLYPLINRDPVLSAFYIQAFCFARRYYDELERRGSHFAHQWCGVAQVAYNDKIRDKLANINHANYPTALVSKQDPHSLSVYAGLPIAHDGLFYPAAGWLSPQQLTCQLVALIKQLGGNVVFQHKLDQLKFKENQWQLLFNHTVVKWHDCVILATGHALSTFQQTALLPLYPVRGQVSHVPNKSPLEQLNTVLCYDGYFTPKHPEQFLHCLGASSVREDENCQYRLSEQQQNLALIRDAFPNTSWLDAIDISDNAARCSIRCLVRDHFPMVGPVPNADYWLANLASSINEKVDYGAVYHPQLFMIGALGARGICSAPLCAEILVNHILQRPQPLNAELMKNLDPARFWRRRQLKNHHARY